MRAANLFPLVLAVLLCLGASPVLASAEFAYIGPGPGLDFVPYFYSLLAWIAFAVGAVLVWPVSVLLSRLRRRHERSMLPAQPSPPLPTDRIP
jgi:hypothetical protein